MPEPLIAISTRLTPETHTKLSAFCTANRITLQDVIERALTAALNYDDPLFWLEPEPPESARMNIYQWLRELEGRLDVLEDTSDA